MNSEKLISQIITLIKKKKNIDFSQYKINTILRRLRQRMNILETYSLKEYYDYLKENLEKEVDILSNYFLINTSEFFRDPLYYYYFEYLVKNLINKGIKYIKILSIGCSSGEEPYSCAMILNERKKKTPEFNYHIDAIDVDEEAIEEAKKAKYMDSLLQNIPYSYLKKYFIKESFTWKLITDYFKDNITFYLQNILKKDFFLSGFLKYNFVFIRNVLLYFKEHQADELFEKVLAAVDEDGYVIMGNSENLPPKYENLFNQVCKGIKIFKLKGSRL